MGSGNMRLHEFLEEDNGRLSNTRLNTTLEIWAGIAILIGGTFAWGGAKLDSMTLTAAFGLLGIGGGQKVMQKALEVKNEAEGK